MLTERQIRAAAKQIVKDVVEMTHDGPGGRQATDAIKKRFGELEQGRVADKIVALAIRAQGD